MIALMLLSVLVAHEVVSFLNQPVIEDFHSGGSKNIDTKLSGCFTRLFI